MLPDRVSNPGPMTYESGAHDHLYLIRIYLCIMNIKYNKDHRILNCLQCFKYKICNDEETLQGKYCFHIIYCIMSANSRHLLIYCTPILGIGFRQAEPLSRQVYLNPFQNLYNGMYPCPRQTLKIGSLLVARPYHTYILSDPPPWDITRVFRKLATSVNLAAATSLIAVFVKTSK